MLSQTDIVVFSVTGTGEPSIQYGNGATTKDPSDGAGPLSDGNYLPWHASMTYSPAAEYYAVTAQLEGSGDISDTASTCAKPFSSADFPEAQIPRGPAVGCYRVQVVNVDESTIRAADGRSGRMLTSSCPTVRRSPPRSTPAPPATPMNGRPGK
jgi:hypothetical protein